MLLIAWFGIGLISSLISLLIAKKNGHSVSFQEKVTRLGIGSMLGLLVPIIMFIAWIDGELEL